MKQAQGSFVPGYAHSLSTHNDDEILGGFVIDTFTGVCACIHMAGKHPGWCTRELLWMAHDYPFNQLGVKKLLALVRSDNYHALSLDLRAGWQIETLIRDMFGDGVHAFILAMTPDRCPWLNHTPKGWRKNYSNVIEFNTNQDVA